MTTSTGDIGSAVQDTHAARFLVRHAGYYLIGRLATGLMGLAALVAFTRVLNPADYGRYAVIIAVTSLIVGVGFQWLRQCLVRFSTGAHDIRQPLLGTLGLLFFVLLLLLVVVCAVLALLGARHVLRIDLSTLDIIAICCLTATQAWFELVADAARTEFRPWRYSIATFLRAALSLVLGIAAALLTHQVAFVVFAMGVAYLMASIVTIRPWLAGMFYIDAAKWDEIKRLCLYGLPLAGTLGLTIVLGSADRLMLAGMRGYTEAGVYSSSYNLAQFSIGTVIYGLGLGSFPLVVRELVDGDKSRASVLLGNNLLIGIGIGLPAVVGLVMLAPSLDRMLLGNYVAGHSDIVTMIVAVAIGFAALESSCVDVIFMLCQRTWIQSLVIGVSVLLNLLLNLVLIPNWGALGAAGATLVAFLFTFVMNWFLSQRYLKINVSLIDITKIILSCSVMVVVLLLVSPNMGGWQRLLLSIVCGGVAYLGVAVLLNVAGSRDRLATFLVNYRSGS